MGNLEPPGLTRMRAGERAALTSKEFALDERRRQRSAVEGNELPCGPRAAAMNSPRHQFLAGARLTEQQHGRMGRRDLVEPEDHVPPCRAFADERVLNRRDALAIERSLHSIAKAASACFCSWMVEDGVVRAGRPSSTRPRIASATVSRDEAITHPVALRSLEYTRTPPSYRCGQRHDDERSNAERPEVKVVVGRKDAAAPVWRTRHHEDVVVPRHPLHTRSCEELRDEPTGHHRTPDSNILRALVCCRHEEAAFEAQLIDSRASVSRSRSSRDPRTPDSVAHARLRGALNVRKAVIAARKRRNSHDNTLQRDPKSADGGVPAAFAFTCWPCLESGTLTA